MDKQHWLDDLGRQDADAGPKYTRLRDALLDGIEQGHWKPGERLPTERELTRLTPFSLGTVQRAMRSLVQDGYLRRQRGRGTFVADSGRRLDEPWHFRFIDDSGTGFLPVFARVHSRRRITREGPWSALLGHRGDNILQVERSINVGDEFVAFNVFYLNADQFTVLEATPLDELHGANFKLLLARAYNLPLTHVAQKISVRAFPPRVCALVGMAQGVRSLHVEITGSTGRNNPIYLQELYVPPTSRQLYIAETPLGRGR